MALDQSQNRKGSIGKAGLFLLKIALLLVLLVRRAVTYLVIRSHDPVYVLRELKDWTDYRRFDPLIVKVDARIRSRSASDQSGGLEKKQVSGRHDRPQRRTRPDAGFRDCGPRLGGRQRGAGPASRTDYHAGNEPGDRNMVSERRRNAGIRKITRSHSHSQNTMQAKAGWDCWVRTALQKKKGSR